MFILQLLYGNEKRILKLLHKSAKKSVSISQVELSDKLNLTEEEIYDLCQSLYNKKYIYFTGLDSTPNITANGKDYFCAEIEITIELILKSIFFPFTISILTTLATYLLKLLLQQ